VTQKDLHAARYDLSQILGQLQPAPSAEWITATVDQLMKQFDPSVAADPNSAAV
jgi:hypothetical protein